MRNFHVPLSPKTYEQLREEASREQRPATELARSAIEHWLALRQKAAIDEEVRAYAERWGGTEVDLDPALEAAGIEHWLEMDPEP
jgi:predicted transcriptional regulator